MLILDDITDNPIFKAGVLEGRSQVQDDIDATEEMNRQLLELTNKLGIGDEVIDKLTSYQGVITRVTQYSDGSFQCYVERTIKNALHGAWFEINRLIEV